MRCPGRPPSPYEWSFGTCFRYVVAAPLPGWRHSSFVRESVGSVCGPCGLGFVFPFVGGPGCVLSPATKSSFASSGSSLIGPMRAVICWAVSAVPVVHWVSRPLSGCAPCGVTGSIGSGSSALCLRLVGWTGVLRLPLPSLLGSWWPAWSSPLPLTPPASASLS